jgi:signal transduction histidine kinase
MGDAFVENGQPDDVATVEGLLREVAELRASRARLASASDADRRDIERALHEGVQQDLVGLAVNLEAAAGSLDGDLEAARALLGELQREARRALTEVQDLAARIFPPLLAAGGIVPELRAAANRAGVPVSLAIELDGAVVMAIAGALYFCAVDVFEHIPAGTPVEVSARCEQGSLAFRVVAECDLGTERRTPHDRIEALGGHVTITSAGDRTTVAGSLPLRDDASRLPRGRGSRP